jgi:acetolactate synthase I/II/III large subunit
VTTGRIVRPVRADYDILRLLHNIGAMTTTTAAATARLLADAGIERVFGLPGGEVLVLMDELRRAGVDFVLMRHEANAGIAAAVYGKLQRQPGVVLTTLGPGAANLMLPLASAFLDQEPLLAISAQIPDEFPAAHTHQLLPLHDVYRPMASYVSTITAESVGDVVPRALKACMHRPLGAAYLTLSAREALKPIAARQGSATEEPASTLAAQDLSPANSARELMSRLATARRPLVVIGLGIDPANAARIRRWVTEWNLPVAVTPKVKGIVDETGANFLGVVSGMAADGVMCDALASADLLIGFGLDPVEVDKTWHAELPIHWILEAPNVGGLVPAGTALVDHAAFLDAMLSARPSATWQAPFAAFQQKRRAMLHDRSGAPGVMWPGDIVESLAAALPPETIVTTDVGSHKYLFGQYWPSRHPETFWMSNGLSGMAYGLSAAIGARLARPGVPVLAVVGDGGFSMNAQELESAERVGAPFVTVVLEDHSYSLIKLSQEGKKLEPYRVDFGPIDTVKMAESCGVAALRTTSPDELASAAARAVEQRRSLVIAVPVSYADYRTLF